MPTARRLITLLPLLMLGCGTEVGRVACAPGQTQSARVELEPGKAAAFWTDLDVEFDGNPNMTYKIVVEAKGETLAERSCDPLDVNTKVSAYTSDIGDHHVRRYQGKMRCEPFEIAAAGTVQVSSTFEVDGDSVAIESCDLVIKQ